MKVKIAAFLTLFLAFPSFSMVQNDLELFANVGYQSLFTLGGAMDLKHSSLSVEYGFLSTSKFELIGSLHYPFRFKNNDIMKIGIGIDWFFDLKDTTDNSHNHTNLKEVLFPLQFCYMKSILGSENHFINFKFRFNMGAEHNVPYIQDNLIGIHIGYTFLFESSKLF
jgi:hypothetical protein